MRGEAGSTGASRTLSKPKFVRGSRLTAATSKLLEIGDGGTLRVRLIGKCATCPASQSTVENLVETVLREEIPWITKIIVSQSVSDELIGEALKFLRKGRRPA